MATTMSSRKFNQDTSGAKRAARDGPVFITDRGQTSHVLLSIEAYHELGGREPTIVDLIGNEALADIDFDPPKLDGQWFRPATFDD